MQIHLWLRRSGFGFALVATRCSCRRALNFADSWFWEKRKTFKGLEKLWQPETWHPFMTPNIGGWDSIMHSRKTWHIIVYYTILKYEYTFKQKTSWNHIKRTATSHFSDFMTFTMRSPKHLKTEVHSMTLKLTVKWLQKVWRAALDAELQRAKQQLEWYDQVILHLQGPSCRKQRCSTWEASLQQSHDDRHFPIHLSSTVEMRGGRKDGKKKMEQHENYSIKCINNLSLLVFVVVFKGVTYPWPKETLSSSSEWSPSPWEKRYWTINHAPASYFL